MYMISYICNFFWRVKYKIFHEDSRIQQGALNSGLLFPLHYTSSSHTTFFMLFLEGFTFIVMQDETVLQASKVSERQKFDFLTLDNHL